jgi:hypothetical protein
MDTSKTKKIVTGIVVIMIVLIIAWVVYKYAFNKMVKGYAKKSGEWVACGVSDYDKDYYKGTNTASADIYFKKNEVKLRAGVNASLGQCADATKDMNVYTLKS